MLVLLVLLGTIYDIFKEYSYQSQLKYMFSATIIQTDTGNAINNDEKEQLVHTYQQDSNLFFFDDLI